MITELRIRNFKGWRDTGSIRLAPLTFFFGTNSSGKSSVGQFLQMLRQTAQSPDRKQVLHRGDKSTAIDLGRYRDIVHAHATDESISFECEWILPVKMQVVDTYSKQRFSGERIKFVANVGLPGGDREDVAVHEMSYRLGDVSADGLQVGMKRKATGKDKYDLTTRRYKAIRNVGRKWTLPPPNRFYGFPDQVTAYYQNTDFVRDLTLALENWLQDIYYLGPLREPPQRLYMWSGEIPEHVGWRGEHAGDAILAARDRSISPGYRKPYRPFEKVIARWLKEMGLINEFAVSRVAPGRQDYEVMIRTSSANERVNVTDVGFGVSQVLPVLVQSYYSPPNSTVIMEQPELHLHPSVQACLADVFIEVVQSREGGADRRIQLLVESHSEHFLRRLQRRIAEERISASDAAVYFCEAHRTGLTIQALDLDTYGNIKNWPEDFFGDEVGDLTAMTEAAIARQKEAPRS